MAASVTPKAPARKEIRVTSHTPYVSKPKVPGFIHDPSLDADISIEPAVLLALLVEQHRHAGKEIAAWGVVEEGKLIWCAIVSAGEPSLVVSTNEDLEWAMNQGIDATGKSVNAQIHTHPTFAAFFSGTDEKDIYNHLDAYMDFAEAGEYYAIVFNGIEDWKTRRCVWKKKTVYWNDGTLCIDGVRFQKVTRAADWSAKYATAPASPPVVMNGGGAATPQLPLPVAPVAAQRRGRPVLTHTQMEMVGGGKEITDEQASTIAQTNGNIGITQVMMACSVASSRTKIAEAAACINRGVEGGDNESYVVAILDQMRMGDSLATLWEMDSCEWEVYQAVLKAAIEDSALQEFVTASSDGYLFMHLALLTDEAIYREDDGCFAYLSSIVDDFDIKYFDWVQRWLLYSPSMLYFFRNRDAEVSDELYDPYVDLLLLISQPYDRQTELLKQYVDAYHNVTLFSAIRCLEFLGHSSVAKRLEHFGTTGKASIAKTDEIKKLCADLVAAVETKTSVLVETAILDLHALSLSNLSMTHEALNRQMAQKEKGAYDVVDTFFRLIAGFYFIEWFRAIRDALNLGVENGSAEYLRICTTLTAFGGVGLYNATLDKLGLGEKYAAIEAVWEDESDNRPVEAN